MKHKYFLFLAFLIGAGCLSAQNVNASVAAPVDGDTDPLVTTFPQWAVGATIFADINSPSVGVAYMKDVTYGPQLGWGYAPNVAYRPNKWFAVRSGLYMMDKNYSFLHTLNMMEDSPTTGTNIKCKYLDMPLMVDFSVGRKVRWHLFLGGYVGYWMSGRRSGSAIPLSVSEYSGLVDEDYPFNSIRDNRFDAGLIYGPGMSIACSRFVDINIELLFFYGLTDVQKDYMMQLNPHYNTTTLLQAGVTFNL